MKKLFTILFVLVLFSSCKKDDEVTPESCPYKHKEISFTGWNMVTTDGLDVAHGLDMYKIKSISVMIYSDEGGIIWPLDRSGPGGVSSGGWHINQTENITLYRLDDGIFDNASFDSHIATRGVIYIDYIE